MMLFWRHHSRTLRAAAIIAVALVAAGMLIWFAVPQTYAARAYADEVLETCRSEAQRESCYEREVPLGFDRLGVEGLFEVVRLIREADPTYQFCHVLAHKIGEYAVAEDPDAWLSLVPLNPTDGICSNGFIHGVIVGRFRDDVFDDAQLKATIPEFSRACEPQKGWSPSRLDQAICYHGMGHLFMFITDADYRRALDACAAVEESPSGNFGQVCREGVFMQTYQPLEPDDFDLIALLPEEPSRDNYRRICAGFEDDEEESACLREAWPLFREEILDGSGIAPFCTGHPGRGEDQCYDTVFAIIGRMSQGSEKRAQILTACSGAPVGRQGNCFGTVAAAFIEENRRAVEEATMVCSRATVQAQGECYRMLVERMHFIYGADVSGKESLCSSMPDAYRQMCNAELRAR